MVAAVWVAPTESSLWGSIEYSFSLQLKWVQTTIWTWTTGYEPVVMPDFTNLHKLVGHDRIALSPQAPKASVLLQHLWPEIWTPILVLPQAKFVLQTNGFATHPIGVKNGGSGRNCNERSYRDRIRDEASLLQTRKGIKFFFRLKYYYYFFLNYQSTNVKILLVFFFKIYLPSIWRIEPFISLLMLV